MSTRGLPCSKLQKKIGQDILDISLKLEKKFHDLFLRQSARHLIQMSIISRIQKLERKIISKPGEKVVKIKKLHAFWFWFVSIGVTDMCSITSYGFMAKFRVITVRWLARLAGQISHWPMLHNWNCKKIINQIHNWSAQNRIKP